MEVVFLYNRLFGLSQQQLDAIRSEDYDKMEQLTLDRELLTAEICSRLDSGEVDLDDSMFHSKVRELTERILETDEDIKDALLEELFQRTEDLNRIKLIED